MTHDDDDDDEFISKRVRIVDDDDDDDDDGDGDEPNVVVVAETKQAVVIAEMLEDLRREAEEVQKKRMPLAKRNEKLTVIRDKVRRLHGQPPLPPISATWNGESGNTIDEKRLAIARVVEDIRSETTTTTSLGEALKRKRRVDDIEREVAAERRAFGGVGGLTTNDVIATNTMNKSTRGAGTVPASSIVDGGDAETIKWHQIANRRKDPWPWQDCPCCEALLGSEKNETQNPTQYRMFAMWKNMRYVFHIRHTSTMIYEFYEKNMHVHQVAAHKKAMENGRECKQPLTWSVDMVENHFRNHIVDPELQLRLRIADLQIILLQVRDQCFIPSSTGRITSDDKAMKQYDLILKQLRVHQKELNSA